MSRPMVRIHNTETDEIIDREMNDVEFAHYQLIKSEAEIRKAETETKETQRQALLARLGITEDEARLLLG